MEELIPLPARSYALVLTTHKKIASTLNASIALLLVH